MNIRINKARSVEWEKKIAKRFGLMRKGHLGDFIGHKFLIEGKLSTGDKLVIKWEQLFKELEYATKEGLEFVILIEDPKEEFWIMGRLNEL